MKKIILISLLSLLFVPLFANASLDTNLYYGLQKNSDVKQLQEFLIDKGFLTGGSTGNFFSLTLKAVKAYQASVGINSTGYVGNLTRTSINNELATNLSASNQEATSETGTTPPTPTPPATTNDVVATLQAQIALLLQQVQAMQAQQTTTQQLQQTVQQQTQTIQQIQQNTQQIVQNTTPSVCIPSWQCGDWTACSNSTQTRACTDAADCHTISGEPTLTQPCLLPPYTVAGLTQHLVNFPIAIKLYMNSNNKFYVEFDTTTGLSQTQTAKLNFKVVFNGQTILDQNGNAIDACEEGTSSCYSPGTRSWVMIDNLNLDTNYNYQITYVEAGRQDSIFNESFMGHQNSAGHTTFTADIN